MHQKRLPLLAPKILSSLCLEQMQGRASWQEGGFLDAHCDAAPMFASGADAWNGTVGLIEYLNSKLGQRGGLVGVG